MRRLQKLAPHIMSRKTQTATGKKPGKNDWFGRGNCNVGLSRKKPLRTKCSKNRFHARRFRAEPRDIKGRKNTFPWIKRGSEEKMPG